MNRLSGANGPALVMRALFAHLNRDGETRALPMNSGLTRYRVCADDGQSPDSQCSHQRDEWFTPNHPPSVAPPRPLSTTPRIRQPGPGLRLALDPRLPSDAQRFRFSLAPGIDPDTVDWYVNGELEFTSRTGDWLWPLRKGEHEVFAQVRDPYTGLRQRTPPVTFSVR
jgi:penicillin-binding protein 1C